MVFQPAVVIWCQNYTFWGKTVILLTYSSEDKVVLTFLKGISSEMGLAALLENEPELKKKIKSDEHEKSG